MSKFLKVVVNIILISAIVVAAGLLIPPFAGVTTVVVDDVDMDTNLAKGSVTYAVDAENILKTGGKVLVSEGGSQYVYEITAVNGETYTLEDRLSTDGGMLENTPASSVKKVLFTVPFIGYISMALRTTEGLIIVGLAVVFVIILFILAEIWKKDDEDDEDEETEEDMYGDDSEDEDDGEDELQMSKRQQKKQAKKAAKEEKKAEKKAAEKAKKSGNDITEEAQVKHEPQTPVIKSDEKTKVQPEEEQDVNQDLFEETRNSLAADIAGMMGLEPEEMIPEPEEPAWEETAVTEEVIQTEVPEEPEKRLAMPVYSKEELMAKAKAAGDEPNVLEDEVSGVTLLDYSDIL